MSTTQTKKLFMYRSMEYGYLAIGDADMATIYPGDYVNLGTCEAAEFVMVSEDKQVAAAVGALEAAKTKARADMQVRIESLDKQIQSLLAIGHEVQA